MILSCSMFLRYDGGCLLCFLRLLACFLSVGLKNSVRWSCEIVFFASEKNLQGMRATCAEIFLVKMVLDLKCF